MYCRQDGDWTRLMVGANASTQQTAMPTTTITTSRNPFMVSIVIMRYTTKSQNAQTQKRTSTEDRSQFERLGGCARVSRDRDLLSHLSRLEVRHSHKSPAETYCLSLNNDALFEVTMPLRVVICATPSATSIFWGLIFFSFFPER